MKGSSHSLFVVSAGALEDEFQNQIRFDHVIAMASLAGFIHQNTEAKHIDYILSWGGPLSQDYKREAEICFKCGQLLDDAWRLLKRGNISPKIQVKDNGGKFSDGNLPNIIKNTNVKTIVYIVPGGLLANYGLGKYAAKRPGAGAVTTFYNGAKISTTSFEMPKMPYFNTEMFCEKDSKLLKLLSKHDKNPIVPDSEEFEFSPGRIAANDFALYNMDNILQKFTEHTIYDYTKKPSK